MADNAAPWTPLPFSDPERFLKRILYNEDDETRWREYADVRDHLFGEAVRFGYYNDREMVAPLRQMYDYFIDKGMPSELRWEVFRHVYGMVENTTMTSVHAFLPFLCRDPDRGIASTAACDYVSLAPLLGDDPMRSPKEVIELVQAGETQNPGAVFGALLVLGDPRLCKLLWPVKDQLSYEEANEAAQITSGFIAAATIDFVLRWMEGLEGTREDALFGSLASHLALQRRHMRRPFVATGLRPFPAPSVTDAEGLALAKLIRIEEYTASIAPRLLALERVEPEPKLMPLILREWGIAAPTLNN